MLTRATSFHRQADWPADQTEAAQRNGETKHLWEESWDDDDTSDDFSNQLKWVVGSLLVSTLLLTALSLDFRPRRRFR
jgi:26 proteasome complex subunit DSS1